MQTGDDDSGGSFTLSCLKSLVKLEVPDMTELISNRFRINILKVENYTLKYEISDRRNDMAAKIITISRKFGSGGDSIGK